MSASVEADVGSYGPFWAGSGSYILSKMDSSGAGSSLKSDWIESSRNFFTFRPNIFERKSMDRIYIYIYFIENNITSGA